MRKLKYTKNFLKNYEKRISGKASLNNQFKVRLNLFLNDSSNPILKNHKLKGTKKGLRAFSVTGDIRTVYYLEGNAVYLVDIGSHNQVY